MMLSSQNTYSRVDVQQLALLFAVLALGASHNLELSPDDPIAEDYCEASRNCLVKGNFMTHSTLAGVQTLVRRPYPYRPSVVLISSHSWRTTSSKLIGVEMAIRRGHCGAWP